MAARGVQGGQAARLLHEARPGALAVARALRSSTPPCQAAAARAAHHPPTAGWRRARDAGAAARVPQDENNLREALKHSAAMLGELRTSLLSPQKYYALYMKTFDELRHLEAFFAEENKRGRSNAELYEIVQHAGNILPRMCARPVSATCRGGLTHPWLRRAPSGRAGTCSSQLAACTSSPKRVQPRTC